MIEKEDETKNIKEEEIFAKIKDELLSISEKYSLMSKYFNKLKNEIINEITNEDLTQNEIIHNDDNNENKEKNNCLKKKRINISNTKTPKKIESLSYSSQSNNHSNSKGNSHKKITHKSKTKNKEKNKTISNTKVKKINTSPKKISEIEENNYEDEENEDDEEEYINSEEENSNSSSEEKKIAKNKKNHRHKKKKIKSNNNGVISKIYSVKIIQNNEVSYGYRVYFKCKGINMCFGPYIDFNFAFEFRKLMLSQLKMFTEDIPDVMEKIEEFFKRTKEAVDQKQAPIEMVKKYKTINN